MDQIQTKIQRGFEVLLLVSIAHAHHDPMLHLSLLGSQPSESASF